MAAESEGSAYLRECKHAAGVSPSKHGLPPGSGGVLCLAQAAPADPADRAGVVWAALAPLLSQQPVVRLSRDRKTYPRRWQRALTGTLPTFPAAVPVYSAAGETRLVVVDLDVAGHGQAAVDRDAAAVTALVERCGGAVIADHSPTGGRHLYIPLAGPVPFGEARAFALALAARTPSMDPKPMLGLTDGLIRPPGSPHRAGGFQVLDGNLTAAHRLATIGNPPTVWKALQGELAAEPATDQAQSPTGAVDTTVVGDGAAVGVPRRGGPRGLPANYVAIARTGNYDGARYSSPSEARQAVVTAAVWAGLSLADLTMRLERGIWPGLASFYARYRVGARRTAVARDWRKAVEWVQKAKTNRTQEDTVRQSPTSPPDTHAPGPAPRLTSPSVINARGTASEYQFLHSWWTALTVLERRRYPGGSAVRMVLRAIGEAGRKSGSRYVAFGTRSLSIAAGVDHTTVAAVLRELRSEADPLIVLLDADRGLAGDLYELRIPAEAAAASESRPWRGGKIHALRPVFRQLGRTAAIVYEQLEGQRRPAPSFDLVTATGLSRSAVYEALEVLAAYNLAQRDHEGWQVVAGTSLRLLAEQLGCLEDIDAILTGHRIERAAYRAAYGIAYTVPAVAAAVSHRARGDAQDGPAWPGGDPGPGRADGVLQRGLGSRIVA